ncbi:MAG: D-alanyl-D-alanine carboxypeptidase [Thermoleophilia bacterium]|nr:D-alanyl-D-alanine carboxypeptidase [Thermoleophilia bacterium]MDQ3857745.1 D-alanyl-D-alanine carboxypeptidase [Actinomycetota bacterium]
MRRLALLLLLAGTVLATAPPASAEGAPRPNARAYLVANAATGEVIAARNANARVPPASITKLMTSIVVLEHARPRDAVRIGPLAASVGESSIDLRPGERLSVRDLLAAALIQSANDAAYALAAAVGHGDVARFVRLMNAKARELGLRETHFVRPDGLDAPGHVSSASDVLILARAAMRLPLVRELVRRRAARIGGGRTLFTWNDLLGSFAGLVGVKTGHTARAGWCEVALARRRGVSIYAVVLGSPTREQRNEDLGELLEWGFEQYARVRVIDGRRTFATADVPFAEEDLAIVPERAATAVVRLGRPLVEEVVAPAIVDPPLRRGQPVGWITIRARERVVATRRLVAARDVPEPSLGERVGWYAGRALSETGGIFGGLLGALL